MKFELSSAASTLRLLAKILVRLANRFETLENNADVLSISRSRSEENSFERNEPLLAALASSEYNSRRSRENFFDKELFGEAAWDMLLDLYVQRASGRQVSVTSSCIAANVPATTALRYIQLMEASNLIYRKNSETDRRTIFLHLTKKTVHIMNGYLTIQLLDENSTEELRIQSSVFNF